MKKNPQLKEEYTKFIHKCAELNHMEKATEECSIKKWTFNLPYHTVIKESGMNTKSRVVFDRLAKLVLTIY